MPRSPLSDHARQQFAESRASWGNLLIGFRELLAGNPRFAAGVEPHAQRLRARAAQLGPPGKLAVMLVYMEHMLIEDPNDLEDQRVLRAIKKWIAKLPDSDAATCLEFADNLRREFPVLTPNGNLQRAYTDIALRLVAVEGATHAEPGDIDWSGVLS